MKTLIRITSISGITIVYLLFSGLIFSPCRLVSAQDAAEKKNENEIVFDFEDGTLQGWSIIEGKFDYLVSDRPCFHNAPQTPYNKQGKYYLSTVEQQPGKPSNDGMTGVVESPVFVLAKPEISLLVGGGMTKNGYIGLFTQDGIERCQFRGKSDTEEMKRIEMSLPAELLGVPLHLQAIDRERGSWGYVSLDDFHALGKIDETATISRVNRIQCLGLLSGVKEQQENLLQTTRLNEQYSGSCEQQIRTFQTKLKELADNLEQRSRGESPPDSSPGEKNDFIIQTQLFLAENAEKIDDLQRSVVLQYPPLRDSLILYVARHPYRSHYHAIDTLFNSDEYNPELGKPHKELFSPGGALKILDTKNNRGITLIETPDGAVRDPDLGYDAERIIFSFRENRDSDYHLWELTLKGGGSFADLFQSGDSPAQENEYIKLADGRIRHHPKIALKQLTTAFAVADFDPIYLPDGSVVFSSTREPKYNMCSRDIASDLYRMDGDGANIYQITKSTLFEHNPFLLDDGRICYHRWEYVDRNFGDAHALWVVTPDGMNQSIYWGNNTAVPGGIYNPNFIGETGEMLCVFGPHHGRENGAIAIINRGLGIDAPESVLQTWPADFKQRVRTAGPFDCDTSMWAVPLKYEDPFVIDSSHFLVSRMMEPEGKTALFLLDRNGPELLLHEDRLGVYDPILIRKRIRPAIPATQRKFGTDNGTFMVMNVYEGTHMNGVKEGSAHYLRVVQTPEKLNFSSGAWFGQGYTAPGMNWHSLENKRILGTVPLEKDGSVAFEVPCDTLVYFQLLDENQRMIQTMRSGATVQSGETIACIGCHEDRLGAASGNQQRVHLAMKKPQQKLQPWFGETRNFGFMREVQPVFDKHCTGCHDYGKPAGEKLNLAPDRDLVFNTAYVSLWNSPHIKCVGAGPAELLPPGTWGANCSPLISELDRPKVPEHIEAKLAEKLSQEDRLRIAAWIDLNGVYYPYYESDYPMSLTGRTPFSKDELDKLAALLGEDFSHGKFSFSEYKQVQVSFERPELSPALARLKDRLQKENPTLTAEQAERHQRYRESLAMIKLGGKRLREHPRADMPNFVPCEKDQERIRKSQFRRQEELRFREAISSGKKAYDTTEKAW